MDDNEEESDKGSGAIKFGWFEGVYMRCLLNIWGVMLFLRLTWVIGQAGLIEGLAIITLSNAVTTITSISMSAVSTNGQIKAGGIYYMISRSLGPEFGGAIGLMFTLANAIAVSMYLIGFCESLIDMLYQYSPSFEGIIDSYRINDVRLIGSISLVLILGLAIVGMEWVTRVQMGLLLLLLVSQIDFIVGSFLPPNDEEKAKGFVGYDATVLEDNLWSSYTVNPTTGNVESFFSVFAVFFPAVTGIVAGANLSGDLKDPGVAIPKGTLLAIVTTYISYIIYGVMVAACTLRVASGVEEEVQFGTDIFNETAGDLLNITQGYDDCSGRDCKFGLSMSQQMMEVISAWGPLIYAGCFAATLSSAIASLVGAPRVFQAVAKDKLFPGIASFAQGWGSNNDPVRGYVLVFMISLICVLIGDLNVVSSLLSNFFVAAYALINFSVFHASITNSPGWRPSFKYYNEWISLIGTILCIVVMFLMDYKTALITFICVFFLYMFVYFRKPDVNWGSSSQSQSFTTALKAVQTLSKVEDHVKNYRPKLIVLSGSPEARPCLLDFANLITKNLSLLTVTEIADLDCDWKKLSALKTSANNWLSQNHIKAFYSLTRSHSFSDGVRVAVELNGLGKLSPNMLLIGFKNDWKDDLEECEDYYKALQSAFDLHLSVGILRISGGLDISELAGNTEKLFSLTRQRKLSEMSDVSFDESVEKPTMTITKEKKEPTAAAGHQKLAAQGSILDKFKKKNLAACMSMPLTDRDGNPVDEGLIERMTQFRNNTNKEGTIDVYWLYDDGGLTLLLPHILHTRSKFEKCKMRVFFLSEKMDEMDSEVRSMANLLSKFRIDFQDVILLNDVTRKPSKETRDSFEQLISAPRHSRAGSGGSPASRVVSEADLKVHDEKTNFYLRIAEIIQQNSASAELIVMTLPMTKKGKTPNTLYMAWLDYITRNMPPFFLIRGNQESVLTFYS